MKAFSSKKGAVTLAELLIVIAIIALLFIAAIWNWQTQLGRGQDARRKSDLARIKIAFEDYYNDKNCYPPEGTLDACGGDTLQPYMTEIPCDPTARTPYVYIVDDDNCHSYRVLSALQDTSDPDIGKVGCSVTGGCGYTNTAYNYGISSGQSVYGTEQSLPPGSPPGHACTPGQMVNGIPVPLSSSCNAYADPGANGCPQAFVASNCNNLCNNPNYWCDF